MTASRTKEASLARQARDRLRTLVASLRRPGLGLCSSLVAMLTCLAITPAATPSLPDAEGDSLLFGGVAGTSLASASPAGFGSGESRDRASARTSVDRQFTNENPFDELGVTVSFYLSGSGSSEVMSSADLRKSTHWVMSEPAESADTVHSLQRTPR